MKKIFEFQETVTYMHSVEVEIEESQEQDFEDFADEIADKFQKQKIYDHDNVMHAFNRKYGANNVTFCEDGSPDIEFEAF